MRKATNVLNSNRGMPASRRSSTGPRAARGKGHYRAELHGRDAHPAPPAAPVEADAPHDLDTLTALISHHGQLLVDVQTMRVRQNNRIKALERAGNAATAEPSHLLTQLLELEQAVDRKLTQYIAQHPLAPFVARTAGLGAGGLGRLLAVTHSLDRFKSPAALWSYLGLAVREGRAPKRATGERARWSPRGRVVCYQIGDAIVKLGRGPYRELYDRKRAEYLARPRVGPSGCPFGQTHSGVARAHDPGTGWQRKTGDARIVQCIKTDAEGNTTSAHVHAAAMRYAVKKLVLHLWVEWQRVRPGGTANPTVPTTRAICAVPAL